MTRTEITKDNYLNYLTFHGQTVEGAWYVVKRWNDTKDYHTHEAIRMWVDASRKFLEETTLEIK